MPVEYAVAGVPSRTHADGCIACFPHVQAAMQKAGFEKDASACDDALAAAANMSPEDIART